jgi:hypothetical protein
MRMGNHQQVAMCHLLGIALGHLLGHSHLGHGPHQPAGCGPNRGPTQGRGQPTRGDDRPDPGNGQCCHSDQAAENPANDGPSLCPVGGMFRLSLRGNLIGSLSSLGNQ